MTQLIREPSVTANDAAERLRQTLDEYEVPEGLMADLDAALRTERLRVVEQIRWELPVRPIGANHSLFDLDMLHTILDAVAGFSGEEPSDPDFAADVERARKRGTDR